MTKTQHKLVSLAREYAALPAELTQERRKLSGKLAKMLTGAGYTATALMFNKVSYVLTRLAGAKNSLEIYDTEVFAKETASLQKRIGLLFDAF